MWGVPSSQYVPEQTDERAENEQGRSWSVTSSLCVAVRPAQFLSLHRQPSRLLRFVSSALRMLSIFQSGHERWTDLLSRCQPSSGLSEVFCQIPLLASPAGSEEINQKERLRRAGALHAATLFYFFTEKTPPVSSASGHFIQWENEEQQRRAKWGRGVLFVALRHQIPLFFGLGAWELKQKYLKVLIRSPIKIPDSWTEQQN